MNTVGYLKSLARKRRLHACAMAALALLGVTVVMVLAAAAWDVVNPLPGPWRMVARLVVPAVLLVAWLQWVFRRAGGITPGRMAAEIEALNPEMGQKLRTAAEIQAKGISADATEEYRMLAGQVVREGNLAVTGVDAAPVLGTHRLRLAGAVGLLLVMVTVFLATRPNDYGLALKRVAGVSDRSYTTLRWEDFPEFHDDRHPARIALRVGGREAEPVLEMRTAEGGWKPVAMTRLPDGSHDVILTEFKETLMLRARAGDAALPPTVVPWKVIPRLVAAENVIRFPGYTKLPDGGGQGGDVEAVEGAVVSWRFQFSAAPARMQWQIEGESPVDLVADGKHTVMPEWEVTVGERQATLTLSDEAGESLDAWHYRLVGIPDKLPVVELLDPAKDIEATAVTEFPVRIRAKDDYGLAEVGLILDSAGNREWVLEQTIEVHDERDINQVVSAMLEKVPLSIRDNVRLHAYALDHKPRGGPRAVSVLRSIDIRDFKRRSRFISPQPRPNEPQQPQTEEQKKRARAINDLITALDGIIKQQRVYTSDVFGFDQSGVVPPQDGLDGLHKKEDTLHRSAVAMEGRWKTNPNVTADDLALLSAAGDQLRDSARAVLIPNLNSAFIEGDAALANLLQLRKNLIELLTKSQGGGEPVDDPPKDVKELAREARRLAKEERDVKGQLEPVDPEKLPAARRQQEVAVYDGGELFSEIVTHYERSDGALELMAEAEKRMKAADEAIHGEDAASAAPMLEDAAVTLLELADFLDSMDLNQLPQTLENLAEKAREDAQKQSEAKDEGKGKGEGEGESKPDAGEAEEKAKRNAELADKILKQLLEDLKAGGAKDEETAERLKELRERNDLEELAKELQALGKERREGGDEGEGAGDEAGRKLDQLARDLQAEADRLKASKLRQLLEAKERAEELKKELAGGEKPGGEQAGKEGKEGKEGQKGEGEGEGGKEGEKPGGEGGKEGEDGEIAGGDAEGEGEGEGKGHQTEPKTAEEEAKARRGGGAAFAGRLLDLRDDELNRIAGKLREGTFDKDSLPLIEEAERRLAQLIDEFPKPDHEAIRRSRIPEGYRREIEDYYRDLSNDIQEE